MAITFIQSPKKFTPSNNDIIFQVSSDTFSLAYFLVEVKDSTGAIISTLKLRPTPMYKTGAFFNLTRILTTQTTLVKTDNIIEYTNDVKAYSVRVSTYITNLDGSTSWSGEEISYVGSFIFNGQIPIDKFSTYDYTAYIASSLGTGKFLSDKPTQVDISPLTTEYLYYINDNRANRVRFTFYYNTGTPVQRLVNITASQRMARINISPLVLEATGTILTNLKYYTVELIDSANLVCINPVYRYLKIKPSISNVQLVWKNDIGGVDSYLFKNIRESINNSKITATTSPYKLNSSNMYSNLTGNIFNISEVTLQSETVSTFTVVSEYLTNDEARWIVGIIGSKDVYVLLDNGKLFPIQIKDNSAQVQNVRYTQLLNQFEVSFTAPSTGTQGLSIQRFTSEQYFPYVLPITL